MMCDCAIKHTPTKIDACEVLEMADRAPIHDDVKLYTTAENFYLVPTINPTEVMVIDRVSGEATVQDHQQVNIPIPEDAYTPVCGFLGSIKLISGPYLVVAKYRVPVGNLSGHDIFQLAGHDIIPYSRSTTHLTSKQIEDNGTYERMLRAALDTPGIYFSYSYDLTHTLQRLHSVAADFHKMSIVNRADPRFLWNGNILKDFTDQQYSRFALPIMQGFVSINRLLIEGEQITWAVVSRRSVQRAGTRLFMRGVDAQGNVANYVETEQIVEKGGEKASFVQTRGSIPLYWTQYPDIMYKPAMELSREEHLAAYTRHMRDQIQRYGNQVLLNLIDQKGVEQALEQGYRAAAAAAALPGVRYEPFDFHTECRGMRYDRVNVLIDRIRHEQTEFGYFLARGGNVLLRQTGVFRTNCIDCLDRTNVLQSMLARSQLEAALRQMGAMKGELPPYVQTKFNGVWADHADMISVQYSGTGALKTDFTRTGKRTHAGLIMDGVNSLTRYYKNNFTDGRRQDGIDLLLGRYAVAPDEGLTVPCPLRQPRDWRYVAFPSLLLVCVSMLCAGAVLPAQYNSTVLLYMMFWSACAGATIKYIVSNGSEFVEWPRLDGGGVATARALAAAPSL